MVETDRLLFSFVHTTDLHYEAIDNPEIPEANARISCLISDIKKLHSEQPLKFVIFTGDLSNSGSASEYVLSEAKNFCDTLHIPYYVVAGNHDLAPNRRIAAMYPGKEDYHEDIIETSNHARVFGLQGIKFSFQEEDYHFIGVSLRDEDPDGLLDWLEETIRKIRTKIILISHYGLYPPRDSGPLHEWGFSRIGSILPRLRSIVDREGSKVLLYLYGHNHINAVVKRNGIYHISSGGIQRGCTGYRLFRCYKNRIEGTFHLLSDIALHNFDYWAGDAPEQCIDSTHSDVEEYHRGNKEEQTVIIDCSSG